MQRISGFIISILLISNVLSYAQDTVRYPINEMKGIRIGVDVSKFVLPLIFSGDRIGFEATADAHVSGNIFATAEAGWLNVTLVKPDYNYKGNGIYGKLGVDYNLLKSRRPFSNDIVYGGARYALSVFNHRADNVNIPGYFWPDASGLTIPKNTMQAQWLEFLLGVKAEVLKNLYVGLTFRAKFLVVKPKDNYSTPYLIPGYGNGNVNFVIGLNYYLSYNFHF